MTAVVKQESASGPACQPGKHLVFGLGAEEFGVHISAVQEIIGLQRITPLPGTPSFVRGVINLRGKIIPVVDLRMRFRLAERAETAKTCIVVVQVSGDSGIETVGMVVDVVTEVIDLTAEQLELPPTLGNNGDTEFIVGVGKIDNRVLIILDVETILSQREIAGLGAIGSIGELVADSSGEASA